MFQLPRTTAPGDRHCHEVAEVGMGERSAAPSRALEWYGTQPSLSPGPQLTCQAGGPPGKKAVTDGIFSHSLPRGPLPGWLLVEPGLKQSSGEDLSVTVALTGLKLMAAHLPCPFSRSRERAQDSSGSCGPLFALMLLCSVLSVMQTMQAGETAWWALRGRHPGGSLGVRSRFLTPAP